MKPVLLLDMDGIVADFVDAYLGIAWSVTGLEFTRADVTEWNIARAIGLSELAQKAVFNALHRPGVASKLKLCPGSVEGVRALQEHVEVVFVTDPLRKNPTWVHDREQWVDLHFPGVDVIYTGVKHHVTGDWFVDDKPENVIAWGERHAKERAFLWDAPWNQHAKNLWRVKGWAWLLDEVRSEEMRRRP